MRNSRRMPRTFQTSHTYVLLTESEVGTDAALLFRFRRESRRRPSHRFMSCNASRALTATHGHAVSLNSFSASQSNSRALGNALRARSNAIACDRNRAADFKPLYSNGQLSAGGCAAGSSGFLFDRIAIQSREEASHRDTSRHHPGSFSSTETLEGTYHCPGDRPTPKRARRRSKSA